MWLTLDLRTFMGQSTVALCETTSKYVVQILTACP